MSAQINSFELLEQIEKFAAIETAAIVKTEEGAERRRGRLDSYAKLTEWVKARGPKDAAPATDYETGISPVATY